MNKICFKFICIIHNPLAWKINKRVVLNKSLYTGKNVKNLRGIVAEPHKWCGTDFLDLASLDPLWNTPSWDIKNGILEKFFLHSGGLAQLIF